MKKSFFAILAIIMLFSVFTVTAFAEDKPPRLNDYAGLIEDDKEAALLSKLDKVSEEYDLDIVFVTVTSIGDKDKVAYADDYYDYNGFAEDGLILLIAVEEGERYVSTCGSCVDKIDVSDLGNEISGYLDSEEYGKAIEGLVSYVEEAYAFNVGLSLVVAVAIGLIVAFVVTGSMKGKLNSVRMQAGADTYLKPGSLNITDSRDIYLYRTVSRTEKPKSDSGTHTSSSGRSHGGGSI